MGSARLLIEVKIDVVIDFVTKKGVYQADGGT